MAVKLKPIVGASSGIGLATARLAASKGARVVLAARSGDALQQIEQELNASGAGQAVSVVADVTKQEDVERIAQTAIDRFGGFDTWYNNAGVGIYGRAEETPVVDARQLFEINFWGEVYGSLAALKHLKQRGGALINMGSVESDRAMPLHSMYAASKHAVQAFTDAVRMEVEKENAPVSVTLIKPAGINTPFTENARNFMENEPNLPPPVYDPQVVARAVVYVAQHYEREILIGGAGKVISASAKQAPRLTDRVMEKVMFRQQQKPGQPSRPGRRDALYQASNGARERGNYEGHVMKSSMYTQAALHPIFTGLLFGAAGVAIAGAIGAAVASQD
jgi:short-subunit dehydrogenase